MFVVSKLAAGRLIRGSSTPRQHGLQIVSWLRSIQDIVEMAISVVTALLDNSNTFATENFRHVYLQGRQPSCAE
jgi:hypothetical protein